MTKKEILVTKNAMGRMIKPLWLYRGQSFGYFGRSRQSEKGRVIKMIWEYENYRDTVVPNFRLSTLKQKLTYRMHAHQNIETVFLLEGRMRLKLHDSEGEDRVTIAEPGNVILINSNVIHGTNYLDDVRFYLGFIPPGSLMQSLRLGIGETPSEPIRSPSQTTFELFKLLSNMSNSTEYDGNAKDTLLISLVNSLMASLMPNIRSCSIKLRDTNEKIDIVAYVNENFRDHELSIGKLSESFGYSERRLNDIFNERVQKTVKQYISDLRINAAVQLLLRTNLGVEAIGYDVGFESPRTFLRVFKAHIGFTPTEFRQGKAGEVEMNDPMSCPHMTVPHDLW